MQELFFILIHPNKTLNNLKAGSVLGLSLCTKKSKSKTATLNKNNYINLTLTELREKSRPCTYQFSSRIQQTLYHIKIMLHLALALALALSI